MPNFGRLIFNTEFITHMIDGPPLFYPSTNYFIFTPFLCARAIFARFLQVDTFWYFLWRTFDVLFGYEHTVSVENKAVCKFKKVASRGLSIQRTSVKKG